MSILFIHERSSVTFKIKVINVSVHLEKTTVTGGLLKNLWRHMSPGLETLREIQLNHDVCHSSGFQRLYLEPQVEVGVNLV